MFKTAFNSFLKLNMDGNTFLEKLDGLEMVCETKILHILSVPCTVSVCYYAQKRMQTSQKSGLQKRGHRGRPLLLLFSLSLSRYPADDQSDFPAGYLAQVEEAQLQIGYLSRAREIYDSLK